MDVSVSPQWIPTLTWTWVMIRLYKIIYTPSCAFIWFDSLKWDEITRTLWLLTFIWLALLLLYIIISALPRIPPSQLSNVSVAFSLKLSYLRENRTETVFMPFSIGCVLPVAMTAAVGAGWLLSQVVCAGLVFMSSPHKHTWESGR
jgi:hypothetical protein